MIIQIAHFALVWKYSRSNILSHGLLTWSWAEWGQNLLGSQGKAPDGGLISSSYKVNNVQTLLLYLPDF